jgi:hypothetical protein
MERLFSPCTRFHDLLISEFLTPKEGLQELNLDVSTEDLLSAERAYKYSDLCGVFGKEHLFAWLTPYAFVACNGIGRALKFWNHLPSLCYFRFRADGNIIHAFALSSEHLLEICDVVLRLLAASVVHSVILYKYKPSNRCGACIDAPALAYLMEHCPSLKVLTLENLEMNENHCRLLGANSRPDLEIALDNCMLTNPGTSALAEVLGRNQGPNKLDSCEIDCSLLANGLRGNSRLKSLTLDLFSRDFDVGNREVIAIANALRENKGLVKLDLNGYSGLTVSDETWGAICDSLKTHPTLEILNLPSTLNTAMAGPAAITSRIQALLDLMELNLSIHTMDVCLRDEYSKHELFRESVIPYLETNRLRPRLLAIQKARPIAYRAKVLGRALLATRTNANSFWMLLSGNAEVAFPSKSATIAAAADLPTPATATSTANIAAVVVSAMSSLTATATSGLPIVTAAEAAAASVTSPSTASASETFASTPSVAATATATATAANVDKPSPGQKRKARP